MMITLKKLLLKISYTLLPYLRIFSHYIIIILGIAMFTWFIYIKFLRIRLPKDIPIPLTELGFYIILYICLIYLYIVKSLLFQKEPNIYIKNLIEYFFHPLKLLDTSWKTSYLIEPYYMAIMSNFISYLESTSTLFRHLLFILFQLIPRTILCSIFILDIFYFNQLYYIYKFLILGLFPLLYRYIRYSLKAYTDHLFTFAERNYHSIYMKDFIDRWCVRIEPLPEAIYHKEYVTIQQYVDIMYENMLYIKNFDLASYIEKNYLPLDTEYDDIPSNIRYYGLANHRDEYDINYAKRFFKKKLKPLLERRGSDYEFDAIESREIKEQFEYHYLKLVTLKDLIPQNEDIRNNPTYTKIRAIIYTIYFILWIYLLKISYPTVQHFFLTNVILLWLNLYVDLTDPFSLLPLFV